MNTPFLNAGWLSEILRVGEKKRTNFRLRSTVYVTLVPEVSFIFENGPLEPGYGLL